MKRRENKAFSGGPAGARSRDLRIKRPDNQAARNTVKKGVSCTLVGYTEPTVDQHFEKPGVRRGFLGSPLPTWLIEAKAHLRRHHPTDGLAESVLWSLHAVGFDPEGGRR